MANETLPRDRDTENGTVVDNTPEAASPRAARSTRSKALFVIVGMFVLMGIAGGLWWLHSSGYQDTDDATLTGHIHPVSARITGTVLQVLVEDNQQVQAGQLVAVVDPTDYRIALSQAEHNLDAVEADAKVARDTITFTQQQAAAQVTQARGGVGSSASAIREAQQAVQESSAGVQSARQAVAQQDANYAKAVADYKRYTGADPEAISAQQLDVATTSLKVADAARQAARASLAQSQARLAQTRTAVSSNSARLTQSVGVAQNAQAQGLQVGVAKTRYQSAQAAIATARDALDQAKLNLGYTRILAPTSGRIGRKTVEIGQRINPGDPLMSIVSNDVWVTANFKETQLEEMRPGQPVEVKVDAFSQHTFTGRVQSFSPASGAQFALLPPENATGNFTKVVQRIPVKILLDPKSTRHYEDLLTPGMSVVVRVNVHKHSERNRDE